MKHLGWQFMVNLSIVADSVGLNEVCYLNSG